MKRTIFYSVAILALGVIAFSTIHNSKSTLKGKETRFTLNTPESVTRITIHSNDDEIELILDGNTWMLANEKANQERVQQTILLFSQLKAAAPAPLQSSDSIEMALDSGTEITFFADKKRVLQFDLCTFKHQLYGKVRRNTYRLTVEAYPNIDLTRLIEPTRINWQDNLLYPFPASEIRKISLDYGTMPTKGFRILALDSLILSNSKDEKLHDNINSELLSQYLYSFSDIRYQPLQADMDSLDDKSAFFTLKIETHSNQYHSLTGFLATDNSSGQAHRQQFIGSTADKGLITLMFNDFDPLLLPIEYFLKK